MTVVDHIREAVRLGQLRPLSFAAAAVTTALALTAAGAALALTNFTLFVSVPGVADPANAAYGRIGYEEPGGRFVTVRLSKPALVDAQSRLTNVTGLAALQPGGASLGVEGADAVALSLYYVSGTFFDVLGVPMQVGRPLTEADDVPGDRARVAVISGRLWAAGFSRASDVLQRTIYLNGIPFAIVGVAADGFHGPERLSSADLWLPGAAISIVNRTSIPYASAAGAFSEFVVRRREGASWDDVSAELRTVGASLAERNQRLKGNTLHLLAPVGVPADPAVREGARAQLTRIGVAAGTLWLVAGLSAAWLLAAAASRGADASAAEAGWLSLFAWAAGASFSGGILWKLLADRTLGPRLGLPVPPFRVPIDITVVLAIAAVTLAGAILFGAAAAWMISQLRSDGRSRLRWAGRVWSLTLVATTIVLLAATASLARTEEPVPPRGFDSRGLWMLQADPIRIGHTPQAARAYITSLVDAVRGVRGVTSVAIAEQPPVWVGGRAQVRATDDTQSNGTLAFVYSIASPNYFETLGVAVTAGRNFDAEEMLPNLPQAPVVVLSQSAAGALFAAGHAIGGSLVVQTRAGEAAPAQVVGIVGDVFNPEGEALPIVYQPSQPATAGRNGFTVIFRAESRPALVGEIRAIARRLDSNLPIAVSSLDGGVTAQAAVRASRVRALLLLAGVAGWLALVALMAQASIELRRRTPASTPPAAHHSSN